MKKSIVVVAGVILLLILTYFSYRHLDTSKTTVTPQAVTMVKLSVVKKHNIPLKVNAVGQLLAPQTVMLKSKVTGVILKVYFKPGQWVKKGQMIVKIDDGDQKTKLANAEATYEINKLKYLRYKKLQKADVNAVSQDDLSTALGTMKADQALVANAKQMLKNTEVRAPFSGLVSTLASLSSANYAFGQALAMGSQLTRGAFLNSGDPIVLISNPDNMRVVYLVPQIYSQKIKYGQAVKVTSTAYPKATFQGKVNFISPIVNQVSQSYEVRAKIDNDNRKLRAGMNVFVTQMLDKNRQVIAIPGIAITPSLTGNQVYVVTKGKVAAKQVTIGARFGTMVEITSGLKAGDRVIVVGVAKVHPGSKVKVVS